MKKYTTKRATIQMDDIFQDSLDSILKTVAPNARAIMETELKRIEEDAVKQFPRRQPTIRKNKEGKVVYYKDESQESWKKFRRGVTVTSTGQFSVYLKNTAPYSWVIRFGVDSKNNKGQDIIQPQGKSVSNELLVKPHRKTADLVVKALSEDLIKRV